MTPSELFKKNLQHYKLVLVTIMIFLGIGYFVIKSFDLRTIASYEIIVVNDLNTQLLIDQSYSEIGGYNKQNYNKYLKNFITSRFINSENNKIGKLTISPKKEYFITAVYLNSTSKIEFEKGLLNFLRDIEVEINSQVTQNFNMYVNQSFNMDVYEPGSKSKSNTQLYFNANESSESNSPNLILFMSMVVGIIIANFILILEYPVQTRKES
jgi:hypothetical protein